MPGDGSGDMRKAHVHKVISYWKSGIRAGGYALLMAVDPWGPIGFAGLALFVAEVLGVAEEVWGA